MARKRKTHSLLGIILCIPIAFIVYFTISYSSHNISPDSVNSVSLTLPDGEQFTYSDSEQVEYFVNALLDAKNITTPIRDINDETPIILQVDRGDKILKYELYPQLNLSGCMVIDSSDSIYLLTSDTAESLLVRHELQYVYRDSLLPRLSVVSDHGSSEILPADYTWYYKKVDGNYYPDKITAVYDRAENTVNSVYPNSNSEFTFSVEPSELDVSFVTSKGDILAISDISYLSFEKDTAVEVTITAKWSELGGADFYGDATYSFPLLYDIPAVITLDKKTYNQGDIAVLNIKHLNEDEQISLETQLDTPGVVCYSQGESTFALLPISCNNDAGEYTLDFLAGGTSYNETVTVNETVSDRSFLSVPKEQYNEMLSPDAIEQTSKKLAKVFSDAGDEAQYSFGSVFKPPLAGTVLAEYGREVIVSEDATSHRMIGTVYSAADGTAVKSAQRGKIVFAESLNVTGNTVIIDHGYGIMSCYFNLKDFDHAVDDIVQQGEIIAYSGSTGYTNGKSILSYAVAVNGVFVNPDIFYNEISLPVSAVS